MNKRFAASLLILLCLSLAIYTGFGLKQAIEGERDLKGQIADLSAARTGASNASVGDEVAQGIASLSTALSAVQGTAHSEELALTAEILVLLAGVGLLRFVPPSLRERSPAPPQSSPAIRM